MRCGLFWSIISASVSLNDTRAGCAKMAERIDVLFGVLDGGIIFMARGRC